jgi:tight adherence protein B
MTGRRLTAATVAALSIVAAFPAVGTAASGVQLTQAQGGTFPNRSFVLTLPQQRSVTDAQVHVTENGQEVHNLSVTPGGQAGPRTFGVLLAIDTSESMHGHAIDDAMAAARLFASKRSGAEQLGIVFFNHGSTVALPPTSDAARIADTLAQTPPLVRGTRIFDATATTLELLDRAKISAGSVVVLSDGADVGSQLSLAAVAEAARRKHVRLFTVGLRSASYNASSLRDLAAAAGGRYAEASSSARLSTIFAALAERFGREYLLHYQSLAPLGSKVDVGVRVEGFAGKATAAYDPPAAPAAAARAQAKVAGPWDSTLLLVAVVVLVVLALALLVYAVVAPRRRGIRSRVAEFVPEPERFEDLLGDQDEPATPVLRAAERGLSRMRWWTRFEEDVDVARIPMPAIRIVLISVTAGLFTGLVAVIGLGNVPLGVVLMLAPVGVVAWVRAKAGRQRRAFDDQLPDNLQVIASAMRAGQSFVGAMATAAVDAGDPSKREFQRVVADEQLGIPLATAVSNVADRMRSSEFEYVGLVAMLQRETGGNTAEVIDRVTETIRDRAQLRRMIRTLTAQGRLSGAVVSLLPVVVTVIIAISSPHYLEPMLHSTAGVIALALAAFGVAAGWIVIRRVVDIDV